MKNEKNVWKSITAILFAMMLITVLIPTAYTQPERLLSKSTFNSTGTTNPLCDALAAAMDATAEDGLISSSFSGDSAAGGVFSGHSLFFPTEGPTFAVLSTGRVSRIPGTPGNFISTDFGSGGPSGDTTTLTLNLNVPEGSNCLRVDFDFESEEFPEWVGSAFNDWFYIFLDGTNIAFDTVGNIINVNNDFFDPSLTPANSFDGQTPLLTTTHPITPGSHTLAFQVGDAGDGIYDTAVFIDNLVIGYTEAGHCIHGTAPPVNQPPVANAGSYQTVEQTYYHGASVTLDGSGSSDPDGDPLAYSWTWLGGSATGVSPTVSLPLGTTTITLVVNDGEFTDTDTVVVNVVDTTSPVITCPADVTVEQATATGTVVPLTATATDICDADVEITNDAPAIFPLGTTTVTFTATDDSGNSASCTTTVTVVDTTDPVITCPADVTVEQATAAGTVVPLTATATDICDASPTITSDELAIYPLGTTTVTFTATDDSGNSASCSMIVTVEDTTPPNVDAGSDITVEQATAAGTEVTLGATVSDICDANPTVTWSHGPTAVFPLGSTIVTVTATDASGNSASDTVVVNVVDTTPPVITCPADVTVEQETRDGTVVPLTATATDICDASPTITSDELAIYPLGMTTVTFTATDDSGNAASCTTTVIVEDTTPPVITASGEQIVLWPPNHKYRTVEISDCVISVTDICDADVDVDDIVITSVSSDEPEDAQGKGDGKTVDDIVIVDSQTVELRAERQGDGNGRVYTINFGVTDASGNTETGSCTVWVPHDQESGSTAIDDGASAGYTVNYP